MGIHEVTHSQFSAFVLGTNYKTTAEKEGWSYAWKGSSWGKATGASWRKPGFAQTDSHPVVCVSWHDAAAFCKWLSGASGKTVSLPTEAQWEYACRAGTTTPFHTGQTISPDQANYNGNYVYGNGRKGVYRKKTVSVASFKPNAWGLYDMHGNAWEWCSDWYGSYANVDTRDPKGPGSGSARVLRGGSWLGIPWVCRAARRSWFTPAYRSGSLGFRVVVETPGIAKIHSSGPGSGISIASHIVYVIDRSGSMEAGGAFDAILADVMLSIRRLRDTQGFHIIFFADKNIENAPRRLVPANEKQKSAVTGFLRGVSARGGSSKTLQALRQAFNVLSEADTQRKGKLIFLLTDGQFGGFRGGARYKGLSGNKAVTQWLQDHNAEGEIHINAHLYGDDPKAIKTMKAIARENGGIFRHISFHSE